MGFWPSFWSSPPPPGPKLSADGTPVAPGRSERSKCWEARDEYFRCLDRIEVLDSIAEKDKAENGCGAEGKGFEADCASSWVSCSPLKEWTLGIRMERSWRGRRIAMARQESQSGLLSCFLNRVLMI
jgi:hypothetical protein